MTFKYFYSSVLNITCVIEVKSSFILTQIFFCTNTKVIIFYVVKAGE